MSKTLENRTDLPSVALFLVVEDTFMSGWGHAEGRTNYMAFPCETHQTAEVLTENALGRTDTGRIDCYTAAGVWRLHREGALVSLMNPEECERWYEPGAWVRGEDTALVCDACSAGLANDDWSHLDYSPNLDRDDNIDQFVARGWWMHLQDVRSHDFTCECCGDETCGGTLWKLDPCAEGNMP